MWLTEGTPDTWLGGHCPQTALPHLVHRKDPSPLSLRGPCGHRPSLGPSPTPFLHSCLPGPTTPQLCSASLAPSATGRGISNSDLSVPLLLLPVSWPGPPAHSDPSRRALLSSGRAVTNQNRASFLCLGTQRSCRCLQSGSLGQWRRLSPEQHLCPVPLLHGSLSTAPGGQEGAV